MSISKPKSIKSILAGMTFLFQFCWKNDKIYIFLLFIKQLTSSTLPLLFIYIPKYVLDMLINIEGRQEILIYIVVFCSLYLLIRLLDNYCDANIFVRKLHIFNRFQVYLSEQLALADYGQIESNSFLNVKEKAFKFLYGETGFASALEKFFSLFGNVLLFASIIAIISTLNIFLIISFLLLAGLNAYFSSQNRRKANQFDIEKAPLERKNMYYYNLFNEYRYGKEIRVNNLAHWLQEKYKGALEDALKSYRKIVKLRVRANYISSAFTTLQHIFTLLALTFQLLTKWITEGDFVMYWSAANSFHSAMYSAIDSIVTILRYNDYYEAVKKYLNLPSTMYNGNKQIKTIETIEFKDVWFRYPGQKNYALKNINVCMNAGEKWSIVGENGSGKSTFIKLLTRLYDVEKGEISVNGLNIREYDYHQYVKAFSVVFQDSQLFSMSVLENVALSESSWASHVQVDEVLQKAGIKDKIDNLREGSATMIHKDFDDNGYEPSGGELQKIALARAIYKNGSLFILDEPTASLDPKAEYELYSHFHQITQDKTVIFISHRLSSTRFCDKVLLFSDGSILAEGTHKELMESNCHYKELYMMQAKYYTDSE